MGRGRKRSQRRPFLAALAERRLGPIENAADRADRPGSPVLTR